MDNPLFSLAGQKVLVIGGTSGIGLATAEAAADCGATVSIAARNSNRIANVCKAITQRSGLNVTGVTLNIEDRNAVRNFLFAEAPFKHLLLPGSTVVPELFNKISENVSRSSFDSKFWGPLWAAIDAVQFMPDGGSITFYSGVAAERPVKGFVIGAAIDGAINSLTRSLALELGSYNLRVNAISPGLIVTPLLSNIDHFVSRSDPRDELAQRSPLAKSGRPIDCAIAAIGFMINDYITGEVLNVEGGARTMP